MGVDKIGPYGLTDEEMLQNARISAGIQKNPYSEVEDKISYDIWRRGYFACWGALSERFAELCRERP